jgi:tRNA-dihydrouridine synthase
MRDQLAPQTLIVGNGDVETRQQGQELAAKYHLDGIMIGRGIFHDPFLFASESPWPKHTKQQRVALFAKHIQLFIETWKDGERPIAPLNKFCKIYINGFDGAKELREQLMDAQSTQELLEILEKHK